MHAPGYICRELFRLHPWIRLAWAGREKAHADEINPGSFALVQLYHLSDAGTQDEPLTLYQFWSNKGHSLGPIYNRHGGSAPDWDPIFRVPILKAVLSDFGMSNRDVFSGKVLLTVKDWLTPLARKVIESSIKRQREFDHRRADLTDEMSKHLWREANKSDATRPLMAYKHCKDDLKAWERQQQRAADVKHYFKRNGM